MKFNTQNAKIEAIDRVRTLCKRKIQKSRNETRHFYFPGFYTLLFQNQEWQIQSEEENQ